VPPPRRQEHIAPSVDRNERIHQEVNHHPPNDEVEPFQGQFLAKSIAQGMMMMMNANNNNMMNVAIDVKNLTLLLAKDVKAESALSWRLFIKNLLRLAKARSVNNLRHQARQQLDGDHDPDYPFDSSEDEVVHIPRSQEMEEDHLLKANDRHLTPMVDNKPTMKMDMSNLANNGREEDPLKGYKLKMPSFAGESDPDVYLAWELKVRRSSAWRTTMKRQRSP
jgi:hypothetical protein